MTCLSTFPIVRLRSTVFTCSSPIPFEEFVRFCPRVGTRTSSSTRAPRIHISADAREALLQAFPWLTEDDLPGNARRDISGGGRGGGKKRARSVSPSGRGDAEGLEHPSDKDVGAPINVAEELALFKDAHDEYSHDNELCFYSKLLGGKWTSENKGVISDGWAGYSRSGAPREWCTLYSWPRQHANYYSVYGLEGAKLLAKEYVRRSHHLFSCCG